MHLSQKVALLLCLFSCSFAAAEVEEEVALFHKSSPAQKKQELRTILLLGPNINLLSPEELATVENGIVSIGTDFPGNPSIFLKAADLIGRPISWQLIEQTKKELYTQYHAEGLFFVILTIPEQKVVHGVLQIRVETSKINSIEVVGNRWTSEEEIKKRFDLEPGDCLQGYQVARHLDFLNRNPFYKVDVLYGPGKKNNTTDLTLLVSDRNPFRIYAGADNFGVLTTRRLRYFAGLSTGNAFGAGHVFSGQYTVSENVQKFQAVTAQFLFFLPNQNLLNLYGGYASVKPGASYPISKNKGRSGNFSLRYTFPFVSNLIQNLTCGGDYKGTNNNVQYVDAFPPNTLPIVAKTVNLTQVMAGYDLTWEGKQDKVYFQSELFWSPGRWLPNQTNGDYATLRTNGVNHWIYWTTEISHTRKLSSYFLLETTLRGQLSNEPLLPSEQMGMGGPDTVRGYEQRQLNFDNGLIGNFELKTIPFPLITKIKKWKIQDSLQILAFFDVGVGGNTKSNFGLPSRDYIAGIGPGLRYLIEPYVSLRFDWGFKLHQNALFQGGSNMVYFSFLCSY